MKIIKNIFLFLAGLIGTLIIIEVYLNSAEIAKTNWTILTPELGKTNKPGMKVIYFSEGFYLGQINSYGYLGPSYPKEKPKDVLRITLNGDSYVEGMHVFDRYHFRTLLENKLNATMPDSIQILNFGKGIFDFYDMYCYEVNFSSKFNADLNLIFVHNIDFQEDRDPAMPYCIFKNDSLVISDEFKKSDRFNKYEKLKPVMESSIGRLSFSCYQLLDNAPAIIFDKFYLAFHKPVKGKYPFPIEFTNEAKGVINNLSKDKRNVIVFWDQIQDDIKQYIKDAGIETIDLYPEILKEEESGHKLETWVITHEEGHFNHEGHSIIAEILYDSISRRINDDKLAHAENDSSSCTKKLID
jgi:hypothetical protein